MVSRSDNGIILEFIHVGAYVKVTAVDIRTGIEASIVGDPARGETALRQTAVRKLRYVLDKQTKGGRA
ncbi:MAG: hypothetical protein HQ481_13880 [Alphaproteobacteria bacterium]|nr:hypothetical protein [Alphaproteobacteria bacterium]